VSTSARATMKDTDSDVRVAARMFCRSVEVEVEVMRR
jgi:hypothetical protein